MVEKKKVSTKEVVEPEAPPIEPEPTPEPEPVNGLLSSEGGIILTVADATLNQNYPNQPQV